MVQNFCGNLCLQISDFSCFSSFFLQFAESPGQIIDNVFDFIEYLQPVNE